MTFKATFRRLSGKWRTDRSFVKAAYARKVGRPLDLSDPRGYHEKVCWLRLNRVTPLHGYCADKITAAAYVASRVGPGLTNRRFFATRDPDHLTADAIPAPRCVIKGNHESQHVIIVTDTATADWADIRRQMSERLQRNFYLQHRERQYKHIRPAIIVEEMMEASPGTGAADFNIYCMGGKPRFAVRFSEGAIPASLPGYAVSLDGAPLPVSRQIRPFVQANDPPPAQLVRMVEVAARLAEPFALVRVDFLIAGGEFRVNELTFSPFAGYNRFTPESFELEMGALIDLKAAPCDWRPYLAAARACEHDTLPAWR